MLGWYFKERCLNLVFDECLLTVVFEELGSHLEIERIKEFISDFPQGFFFNCKYIV